MEFANAKKVYRKSGGSPTIAFPEYLKRNRSDHIGVRQVSLLRPGIA
jgi:hypothetical protein